jgi:hypothetical protein
VAAEADQYKQLEHQDKEVSVVVVVAVTGLL